MNTDNDKINWEDSQEDIKNDKNNSSKGG